MAYKKHVEQSKQEITICVYNNGHPIHFAGR